MGGVTYEDIIYDVEGPAALITLNRPKHLNAWTDRMGRELRHALAVAEADPDVVGIVITGAGRGFCAGADMGMLQTISEGSEIEKADVPDADPGDSGVNAGFRKAYTYFVSIQKPILAAINGPCAGMALPIACFCDLRFAAESASFHAAFPRRGLVAEHGVAWILPRLVGAAHAFDILVSGRRVSATEARLMGLVNSVVRDDELVDHAIEYVRMLAQNCSPTSMATAKRQIYHDLFAAPDAALEETNRLMLESLQGADFKEGVRAFLDRRPAKFRSLD